MNLGLSAAAGALLAIFTLAGPGSVQAQARVPVSSVLNSTGASVQPLQRPAHHRARHAKRRHAGGARPHAVAPGPPGFPRPDLKNGRSPDSIPGRPPPFTTPQGPDR